MIVDIGGTVRQDVGDFIWGVYTKSSGIYCGFASILHFGLPNFWEIGALKVVGISGIGQSASKLLQSVYTKS